MNFMTNSTKILLNYRRLKSVKRFNNFQVINPTNVSEHSYFVAMLCEVLGEEWNSSISTFKPPENRGSIDVELAIKLALFHDLEETFTSDIPWNVKHQDSKLNAILKEGVSDKLNKIFSDTSLYRHCIFNETAKMNLEGELVSICDLLEGAWYCFSEIQLGNVPFVTLLEKYLFEIRKIQVFSDKNNMGDMSPTFRELMYLFSSLVRKNSQNDSDDSLIAKLIID